MPTLPFIGEHRPMNCLVRFVSQREPSRDAPGSETSQCACELIAIDIRTSWIGEIISSALPCRLLHYNLNYGDFITTPTVPITAIHFWTRTYWRTERIPVNTIQHADAFQCGRTECSRHGARWNRTNTTAARGAKIRAREAGARGAGKTRGGRARCIGSTQRGAERRSR